MVDTTKFMWNQGDIVRELVWKIPFLIPKRNMDTWSIGLLE